MATTKRSLGALYAWRWPTDFKTICQIKNVFEKETPQPLYLGHLSGSKRSQQMRCGYSVPQVK